MRHIIQRIKRNPKLQDPYFWNAQEEKLYFLSDGVRRLCIPAGLLRLELLKLCHDVPSSGHPGRDRTYSRLARSYYWPRMSQYVKRFVRSCKKGQHSKGDRARQAPLQCLPVPSQPWQDISMDFITGLPVSSSGSNAVLTFIDRLTKQAHFVPTKTTVNAVDTAELYVQNVFRLHGLSRSIVSDRDPRFTSEVYRSIFNRLGVDLKFSTANHPQTDGLTERVHRTIEQILRSVVHHRQTNWEDMLPMCEFAYNDMVQASTCETPFFMNHGLHPISIPEFVFASPPQPETDGSPHLTHFLPAGPITTSAQHTAATPGTSRPPPQTNCSKSAHSSVCVPPVCRDTPAHSLETIKGRNFSATFIDFMKAFDRVWHAGLLYKLAQCGISSSCLAWIQD